MDLHYLTFMRRSLDNRKKLMPNMNSGGIVSDSVVMNSIFSGKWSDEQCVV